MCPAGCGLKGGAELYMYINQVSSTVIFASDDLMGTCTFELCEIGPTEINSLFVTDLLLRKCTLLGLWETDADDLGNNWEF